MKPISYLLIQFFIMSESSVEVLNQINWAGFNPLVILAVFGAGAVFFLARLRKRFLDFLGDIDEDDNLYIGKIISWTEDSLVFFGFLLLIWTGVFMVILYAILVVLFIFLRKLSEKRVENQKIDCKNCGKKILPFAVSCQHCGYEQQSIFGIGFLGNRKASIISDISKHKFNLLAQRRCPECATKSEKRTVFQVCNTCGSEFFKKPSVDEFIKEQDKKFKLILFISFFLGLIPVVGFVISASLVGINLLSPYRKYISKTGTFISKVLIRMLTIAFFVFGVGFGFVAAPMYCLIRYTIIKNQFKLSVFTKRIKNEGLIVINS
jgi:hypothetical protein